MNLDVKGLRRSRRRARLRRALTHPVLWGAIAALLLGWLGYRTYRPVIERIPVIAHDDDELTIPKTT